MPQGLKAESFRFVMYGLKPVPTCFQRGSHADSLAPVSGWYSSERSGLALQEGLLVHRYRYGLG
jgi:hypothetical protein